ncbi:MAG: LacI family DNA-binding transcriptional regulator, partial [Propionibacteriaceae bacterium]|nr:LacI family DNA-binding transcriptional regulator [Propionibacteriaceae bacterium]
MATTIEDVARAAGVSTATVSRALRGLPHVTDETRELVRRTAQGLGYVPSPSAAALASGRTRTVGLVAPAISRW